MSHSDSAEPADVLLTVNSGVATILLNRPKQGNALNLPTTRLLADIAAECEESSAIRCVLLTGAGRMFCVGGDITAFAAAAGREERFFKDITLYLNAAVTTLARMPKPLVTAINGPAAGAGLGLAALGDIVIAGRSAHFSAAYSAIGVTPDAGLTWLLPKLIGLRRAQDMILTNRRVGSVEAETIGLVTRAVEDENVLAEAQIVARSFSAGPVKAFDRIRKLLLDSATAGLDTQLAEEARAIALAASSAEGREGVRAFLEKRKPAFVA